MITSRPPDPRPSGMKIHPAAAGFFIIKERIKEVRCHCEERSDEAISTCCSVIYCFPV